MELEQNFWQTGPSQAVQMEATTTTTTTTTKKVLDSKIQAILADDLRRICMSFSSSSSSNLVI